MKRKALSKLEAQVLGLLETLPGSDETYGVYWMHEPTLALLLFGSQTGGAIRKARRLLKKLENRGLVECQKWEFGVSWRLREMS
jgi:hypothetical protein